MNILQISFNQLSVTLTRALTGTLKILLAPGLIVYGLSLTSSSPAHAGALKLNDIPYDFGKDLEKLKSANDSYQLFTKFVDYFYSLSSVNQHTLQLFVAAGKVSGWCVGDAHPENFGVLLLGNGRSLFTATEIDDAGPCPVILDLLRFMTAAKLYELAATKPVNARLTSSLDINKLVQVYIKGLRRESLNPPSSVDQMISKSQERGYFPDPNRVSGSRILRDTSMSEVTPAQMMQIKAALAALRGPLSPQTVVLDLVSTRQGLGRSPELVRFEVLLNNNGTRLHLELKKLLLPAITPMKTMDMPQSPLRIANTIMVQQGPEASPFYKAVSFEELNLLILPRFGGNIPVDLKLEPGKPLDEQTWADNLEMISYEAFTLGQLHARSIQLPDQWSQLLARVPATAWQQDIDSLTQHFVEKYAKIKPHTLKPQIIPQIVPKTRPQRL